MAAQVAHKGKAEFDATMAKLLSEQPISLKSLISNKKLASAENDLGFKFRTLPLFGEQYDDENIDFKWTA